MTLLMRRRHFVAGGLAGLLAGPFVRMIRNGHAQAQPKNARAFVVFQHTHNMRRYWWPTGTETDFTLSEAMSPLEPLREHCVFLQSMMMKSGLPPRAYTNHAGNMHILTAHGTLGEGGIKGGALGPSIDQVIADQVGQATPVRSLNLWTFVNKGFPNATICYRGAHQGMTMEPSPHAAFKQLMVGTGAMASSEFEHAQKSRRSILDHMLADLGSLQSRLAAEERRMLDAHVDAVRTVEKALFGIGGREAGSCKGGALSSGEAFDYKNPRTLPELIKLHTEVIVMALACDITRVAVLQIGNGNNNDITFPWIGVNTDHHIGIQHNGGQGPWTAVTKWFNGQYAQFLNALKAVPTPTGNLLTDSVTVLCHNMGSAHAHYNMGFIVGGNARGQIRGNRYLQTGDPNNAADPTKVASHAELWLACAHAMGLRQMQSFGHPDPAYCRGPLPGLLTA